MSQRYFILETDLVQYKISSTTTLIKITKRERATMGLNTSDDKFSEVIIPLNIFNKIATGIAAENTIIKPV